MPFEAVNDHIMLIDAPFKGITGTLGTYLVSGEEAVVIDPGPTTQTTGVIDVLKELKVRKLKAVLLTHIHLDHGGGSWKLLEEYPEAYLYCHPRGALHMVDPSRLEEGARRLFGDAINEYGKISGMDKDRVIESKDKEIIELGGVRLEVYWTPGHSSHSQCYFEPESRTAIVGDAAGHTMWQDIPLRPTSPPPHNPEQAIQSIELIRSLKPETLCISHFGAFKNPDKHLVRIKTSTELWHRLAIRAVNEGLTLEEFEKMVWREDEQLSRLIKEPQNSDEPLKNSIMGFYMYAQWKNSQN